MSLLSSIQILVPSATQEQVDFYLGDIMAQAEKCLSNYPEAAQEKALAYLFAHLRTSSQGGQVTQERTRTGASRSYAAPTGTGLRSTQFGTTLADMTGAAQCLREVMESPTYFAVSINPKRRNGGCRP